MEPLGAVWTPPRWAEFAVRRSGLVAHWLGGGSVLDPTLGTANLLVALVELALAEGHSVAELPLERLVGVEIQAEFRDQALAVFQQRFGVDMSGQFLLGDVFEVELPPFTAVLGNPPWVNFSDLPTDLKERFKPRFLDSGLVSDARTLLWGGARIDLAALVVQRVVSAFLAEGGEGWFFLPLSLFLNDGAHRGFRSYRTAAGPFSVVEIFDLGDSAFPGVSTRQGLVHLRQGAKTTFPVAYWERQGEQWCPRDAAPAWGDADALSVVAPGEPPIWQRWARPALEPGQRPRQGLNTGGANEVFFFDRYETVDDELCRVGDVILPQRFVHPLLTSASLRDADLKPQKWVLVPHDREGRPLGPEALDDEPLLAAYLCRHQSKLESRRGALLAGWRQRGRWWALLGVGPYSFAPFKVVWEAYGKVEFRPVVREGLWQVNQSLQAFIPCANREQAQALRAALDHPAVHEYLASTRTGGTKGWAQPGRLSRLLGLAPPSAQRLSPAP